MTIMQLNKDPLMPRHSDYSVISAPFGKLGIFSEMVDGTLTISQIRYLPKDEKKVQPKNQLVKRAVEQMDAYFVNPNFEFNLPLKPFGSNFQNKVWTAILSIPVGTAITYGELAKAIKSGARAVGGACGANNYPLVIPCHRVLAKQGTGGFMGKSSGWELEIKSWLLRHEGLTSGF
jgi:methylated-DNA-[protein]-cysteine S-methyltransferase